MHHTFLFRAAFIPFLLLLAQPGLAQKKLWHLEAPRLNKSFGIDAYGAAVLLKGKVAAPVIVAVIDNGAQTSHKYLQEYIWVNKGEIPGNNKDDDGNGYIDDVNGWSFLGGKGGDISYEADEKTRLYFALKEKYADTTKLTQAEKDSLDNATATYNREQKGREADAKFANRLYKMKDGLVFALLGKATMGKGYKKDIIEFREMADSAVVYNRINTDSLRRAIVGDDPDKATERIYGNNHLDAAHPAHGTHTAGIVLGVGKCIDNGSWLKIMPIRAIPNGDERDKDVANAIRYAVDNGAKVINMSFGKYAAQHPEVVKEAILYAQRKDVLLIHGAGNEAYNLTDNKRPNYPGPFIDSATRADNFIQVGATSKRRKKLVAAFSNFGRNDVDIMAPGVDIYSSVPVDAFEDQSGTSMAAPVVAGVAAVLRSYYPALTAAQVKELLTKTVTRHTIYSPVPGRSKYIVQLWYFSRSAGIVNAAKAVELAARP